MISPHYEGHSHVMVEDRDRQTLQCQQCNGFSFAARCTTVSGNALTRYTARGLVFRPVSLCCLACYCTRGCCRSYTWVGGGGHNGLKSILRAHSFLYMLGFWWFINEAFIHSKFNLLSINIVVHNKKCTPSENISTHCDFTGWWPCKSGGKASMADTYYRLLGTRCILQRSYFKPSLFLTFISKKKSSGGFTKWKFSLFFFLPATAYVSWLN